MQCHVVKSSLANSVPVWPKMRGAADCRILQADRVTATYRCKMEEDQRQNSERTSTSMCNITSCEIYTTLNRLTISTNGRNWKICSGKIKDIIDLGPEFNNGFIHASALRSAGVPRRCRTVYDPKLTTASRRSAMQPPASQSAMCQEDKIIYYKWLVINMLVAFGQCKQHIVTLSGCSKQQPTSRN